MIKVGIEPWVSGRLLHFVRHGHYNREVSGSLTPLGAAQALRIARHFSGVPIDVIRSSTAARATETAELLARTLGQVCATRHRILKEVLPAPVPGMRISVTKREKGARQIESVLARFFTGCHKTRHEVIVCHGNLIRSLVLRVTTGKPKNFHRLVAHHAGVTTFMVSEGSVSLIGFNAIDHLPCRMRSY